jgi:cytoskeletal protein CcmA (bactofilin family)
MQLKKSPRDDRYPDAPGRYESESYGVEPTESYTEFQPEGTRPRAPRPASNGRAEGDDRTAGQTRSESLVDRHSSFDGRYETDHDLRVEGSISGEVVCRGLLTIEQEASARARINARDAHIRGRLEGDIVCSGKLLLAATAVVTGTLKAPILVVEEGASLSGSVDTTQKAGDIVSRASSTKSAAPPTATAPTAPEEPAPAREPAIATRTQRREVPSFALVSSDAGAAAERRP